MWPIDSGFLLQVLAIGLGGGTVQLLIFLLRRRAEIRELDAKADASLLTSANDLISNLRQITDSNRSELADMRRALAAVTEESRVLTRDFTSRMASAQVENRRLSTEVARLRTDLDISQRQVDQLRAQLRGSWPAAEDGRPRWPD